ncbi:MAG TPA: hypothetical protein DCY93_04145 [Firmicutes bacterium]|nr:hypothetical protein [Bacillota bacterium]
MKILLAGLGKSNRAVMDYLKDKGEEIYTYDDISLADYNYSRLKSEMPLFDIVFLSPGIKYNSSVYSLLLLLAKRVENDLSYAINLVPNTTKIIAVTGSNGKTTTVTMLEKMLKLTKKKVVVAGNIGIPILERIDEIVSSDYLILEISSFQAINFAGRIDILIITSLAPNHLDYYHNYREYLASKKRLILFSKHVISDNEVKKIMNISCEYKKYIADDSMIKKDYNLALNAYYYLKEKREYLTGFSYESIALSCRNELFLTIDGNEFYDDSKSTSLHATLNALKSSKKDTVLILGGHLKSFGHQKIKAKKIIIYGKEKQSFIKYLAPYSDYVLVNELSDAVDLIIDYLKDKSGYRILFSPGGSSLYYPNFLVRGKDFERMVKEKYEL